MFNCVSDPLMGRFFTALIHLDARSAKKGAGGWNRRGGNLLRGYRRPRKDYTRQIPAARMLATSE